MYTIVPVTAVTAPVGSKLRPSRALIRVLLPTPVPPKKTSV